MGGNELMWAEDAGKREMYEEIWASCVASCGPAGRVFAACTSPLLSSNPAIKHWRQCTSLVSLGSERNNAGEEAGVSGSVVPAL